MDLQTYALVKNKALTDLPNVVEDWLEENVDPETGYVLDSTLALADAAAPAKTVGDALTAQSEKIDELKSAITFPYSYSDIEQNGVDSSGKNNTSASRIRTAGFIPVIEGGKVKVSFDSLLTSGTLYVSLSFYSMADLTVSRLSATDWGISGAEIAVPTGAKFCRAIWKKNNAGTDSITPSVVANVMFEIKTSDVISNMRSEISSISDMFKFSVPVKVGTLNSNGIESSDTTVRLINDGFIPVTVGQTLYISWDSALTLQCSPSFYTDADYTINRTSSGNYGIEGTPITVPSGVKYMRLIWRVGSAGTASLPLSSLSNVYVHPMVITDIVKAMLMDTRPYAVSTLFDRQNLDLTYIGDIAKQQAFCKYNGKWYSTDGTGITVQASDFTVESTTTLSLGHGNSMHVGTLHPEYAYVSGWDDQKVYVVNLSTLAIVDTINLPTTGYTTAAIDDVNGIAYIFQRESYPDTNSRYNFIIYDYVNEQTISTRQTMRSFGAMQACDIWQDKIIVANGQGKSSGIYNYYLIYDRTGNIVQEIFLPTLESKEPEGIMIDRTTGDVWIGVQISGGGQNLYKITRHQI